MTRIHFSSAPVDPPTSDADADLLAPPNDGKGYTSRETDMSESASLETHSRRAAALLAAVRFHANDVDASPMVVVETAKRFDSFLCEGK